MSYVKQSHVNVGDPITASGENTGRDNMDEVFKNAVSGGVGYFPTTTTFAGLAKPSTYPGVLNQTVAGVLLWLEPSAPYQAFRSSSGSVPQWSNQGHMTRAVRNSDYTFTRSNLINWDLSTALDDDNQHDPSSNPSRITIAETGIYLVILHLKMSIGNSDWAMDCQVRVNGTPVGGNSGWGGNGGGATRYFGCIGEANVTAGQYIEGFLDWNGTGTTCTIYTASNLFVLRLR
jgi:hypothetical protein